MVNKLLLITVLLILAGGKAGAEDPNELANMYYQSGLVLLKQNNYEDALGKFHKALAYRRNYPEALFKLGECYEKTKEPRKALQKYRLSVKYFQQRPKLSREEQEFLATVLRTMEKIDVRGKQLGRIKSDYFAKLLAAYNDCFQRKLFYFAGRALWMALAVEPANKKVLDLVAKLEQAMTDAAAKKSKPKAVKKPSGAEIFNGLDLSGWEKGRGKSNLSSWRVEKGRIVADPGIPDFEVSLVWKDAPPKYKVTIRYRVEKILKEGDDAYLGVAYACGNADRPFGALPADAPGVTRKITLLFEGTTMRYFNEYGEYAGGGIPPPKSPGIVLYAKNAVVNFTSVTLEEIK